MEVAILHAVVSKRTPEQRLGRSEAARHGDGTGKGSRSRRNSKYRGLRQEPAQCDGGTVRQPVWPEAVRAGESSRRWGDTRSQGRKTGKHPWAAMTFLSRPTGVARRLEPRPSDFAAWCLNPSFCHLDSLWGGWSFRFPSVPFFQHFVPVVNNNYYYNISL